MTDQQRSTFRFRVPRLRPSVPPPRTIAATTTTITRTPARKPPARPQPQPSTQQPAPSSTQPQGTSPAPPPPVVPSPASLPQEPTASPPQPQKPLVAPSLAPSPPQKSSASPPLPQQTPALPPLQQKSPPTPSLKSLGKVPTPPPEPPVEPSPPPSPQQQNQPTTMPPTPIQTPPRLQPTSQPPNISTNITSNNHQITSTEQSSEYSNSDSHTESISTSSSTPNTSQTKSIISHPDNKIPEPESPETRNKPNVPQTLNYEQHTRTNTPRIDQFLNEKPAIITLAGDNKGTSMHIGSGPTNREKSIHIFRKYKANNDEILDAYTTDEDDKENDSKAEEKEEKSSYINCNIQGINNSMVFNCSITERSPGVHFGSCNKDLKKPKRKYVISSDMNKLKINTNQLQKHRIRRRCLRGLFMESSESDPSDPQTSRRHGCRYIRGDKSNKDDKNNVV